MSIPEIEESKILLSELSKDKEDWSDIIESMEDNKLSDYLESEASIDNLKELALDVKERLSHKGNNNVHLQMGFNSFDRGDLHFLDSGLIILEASKNTGKTAFALQAALQIMKNTPDIPIFYFAYGDNKKDLQVRILLNIANIPRSDYRKGNFSEETISNAIKEYQIYGRRFFLVQGTQTLYPDKIKNLVLNTLNRYYDEHKINAPKENSCVIFVDYLQSVPSVMGQNIEERIFNVTNSLKDIAKIISSPVILLSGNNDLERLVTENQDIKVTVEKKDTLDFAADVYISIVQYSHRGKKEELKNLPKDVKSYRFNIEKNKNGIEGSAYLYFSRSTSTWFDVKE